MVVGGPSRKTTVSSGPSPGTLRGYNKHQEMDFAKIYLAMQKGHKVCKINVLKKWDPAYKLLTLNMDTRQLFLAKLEQAAVRSKPTLLDLRHVREVQTLDYKLSAIQIGDKWKKDREIQNFDPLKILVISYGTQFTLKEWTLLFESAEACRLWNVGVHNLMLDTRDRFSSSHCARIERFIAKHFYSLVTPGSEFVARKHMKPFVQTSLQYKVSSRQLQEVTEDQMNLLQFSKATRNFIHSQPYFEQGVNGYLQLFMSRFAELSEDAETVSFDGFMRFLENMQSDDMVSNRTRVVDFLRRENSIWDSTNEKVIHDMTRPLSHYWIASSHNTYLTGDQLRSESSLDSYAQALLMGCRCIEFGKIYAGVDCWDGQRKPNSQEFQDIVIYHGYTMTSKLLLRDVLYVIKHYAFITSVYPIILSIEDNCSVPAQRLLAQEIKEILGDDLLTQPASNHDHFTLQINPSETELPSPAALKKKIILKHKKLPIENEDLATFVSASTDEFQDTDILARECIKKGMLSLMDSVRHEWSSHVFILFPDRLCYLLDSCDDSAMKDDSVSMMGDEDREEDTLSEFGVRPEEQHITEEWFHGHCGRDEAKNRLLEHKDKGNGLFMVRDSNLFLGDFSLTILHDGKVHHVRIKTRIVDKEKKYYFMDNKVCDTLYELVSYYTRHYLTTPTFKMALTTPCPQPQPHLGQPWFSETADKEKAEALLSQVPEDGAFLLRYSSSDKNVFVLSIRVDGEIWHYRLKRDGRIFVVNQTVFENLNQIVEYYRSREFVRGISLRIPVNENDMSAIPAHLEIARGSYQELSQLEEKVLARALRPYRGTGEDDLSFPANAIITVLRKEEALWTGLWSFQLLFASESEDVLSSGNVLVVKDAMVRQSAGSLLLMCKRFCQKRPPLLEVVASNYNTIELAGTVIERVTDGEKQHVIKISHSAQQWSGQQWLLAARSVEEADDWQNQLWDLTRSVNNKISVLRTKEKSARIAAELSNLVVYCQAVPFDPAHVSNGSFYEMCSFVENKLDRLLEKGLISFNIRQLSRVYPHGSRITSANYNPVPMWNASCHMVALNYQTGDKPMQLNQGKFMGNGRCGYVLKPEYMLDEGFDPSRPESVTSSCPVRLTVQVIAGRHLSRRDKHKGICSPFVEVEVIGLPCDEATFKTRTIASNGLNPIWNQTAVFDVSCPEVALLRFHVEDGDFVGPKTDPFIGQAVFPLDSIRCGRWSEEFVLFTSQPYIWESTIASGFRSVPLLNQFSEELELSALLVDVQMITLADSSLSSRMAPVFRSKDRKLRSFDSVNSSASLASPSAPREIPVRPAVSSSVLSSSVDSPSPSATSIATRKFSAFQSQDSFDSTDSMSPTSNGTISSDKEKKRGKWGFPGFRFRSKDKDHG
ncbi:Phosphatidylinositol-specific phospholipase C, X domain protein [Ancylostoma duodenale]|uniref:Phosphoinositide phospholipase C n=1 Tax=Ancylostoma duodenale TaxID=51022 RepID=A0A0C2DPB2_9BILA|nr:Phosphatidylinositol-specific phospholipase C, X domain protein [Ancylostoma duodenale]